MAFDLEKDMYDTTLAHLPALIGFDTVYAYGIGIPLSYKIADIGLTSFPDRNPSDRLDHSLAQMGQTELWMLAKAIERDEISALEIPVILGRPIPDSDRNRMVDSLCNAGLLRQNDRDKLVPTEWLSQQLGPVVFVELKLSRWRQALDQAIFYLRKADMSCVILDGDAVETVPMAPFKEAGVGLFAAWPGRIDVRVLPKPNRCPRTSHRHFNRLRAVQDLSRKHSRKWVFAQV